MRLMPEAPSEAPQGSAAPESKWAVLAPPAMAAQPQAPARSIVAFVHATPAILRLARPLLAVADARIAPADYARWRIASSAIAHTCRTGPLPIPAVVHQVPSFPSRSCAPAVAALLPADRMRLPSKVVPSAGCIAIRSCISSLDAAALTPRIDLSILHDALQLPAGGPIGHREWIRTPAPPPSISIHEEQSWAHNEIGIRWPLDGIAAPASTLVLAEATEHSRLRSAQWDNGIRTVEPSHWWETPEDLRFPCMAPADPQLRWCIQRPVDLGAAGSPGPSRQDATVRELPSIAETLYPMLTSAVEPALPSAFPPFMLDHLIGAPAGVPPGDCVVTLPARLLVLKRGAVEETRRGGGSRLPTFQSIPMEAIRGSAAPIISFEPLHIGRVPAFARQRQSKVVAMGRGGAR